MRTAFPKQGGNGTARNRITCQAVGKFNNGLFKIAGADVKGVDVDDKIRAARYRKFCTQQTDERFGDFVDGGISVLCVHVFLFGYCVALTAVAGVVGFEFRVAA
jgi:hypothetical protein